MMVPEAGLEPARLMARGILNLCLYYFWDTKKPQLSLRLIAHSSKNDGTRGRT